MGLHTAEEMEQPSFEHYWLHSLREVPDKGALAGYWTQISSGGDFTATAAPAYRLIRDPRLRMIHRLMAYSICGRAQGMEKVTATDLFFLRSMDVGPAVNVPFLLA